MEHNNTIPSVLGPMSGPERRVTRKSEESAMHPLFKLVFWASVVVVVVGVVRYFGR